MAFVPFPTELLSRLVAPPGPAAQWGYELLPFVQWLLGHSQARAVAVVEDGRGLAAPLLREALAGLPDANLPDGGLPDAAAGRVRCHVLDAEGLARRPAGTLDLIHVTAEGSDEELGHLARLAGSRLAEGGVLLMQHPPAGSLVAGSLDAGSFTMVALPIGDGVAVMGRDDALPSLVAWLRDLSAAERASLGRFFDALGAQAAHSAAHATARVAGQVGGAGPDREQAALREALEQLKEREHERHVAMLRALAERDEYRHSTSWRVTAPLRRLAGIVARVRHPARTVGSDTAGPDGVGHRPAPAASADAALWDFLTSGRRLSLPQADAPAVSILLRARGSAAQVHRCLQAVAETVTGDAEVVILADGPLDDGPANDDPVNDAPSDEMARLLERLDGARVLRDQVTLRSGPERALQVAGGRAVLLLEAGTRLQPGALQAALAVLDAEERAGAVGAMVAAGGAVVQAGEVIGPDGVLGGYAAGQPADAPEIQFRRRVRSCAGGFLLVRATALRELGSANPAFVDTRYAAADLCARLAMVGWHTVYEPLARVWQDDVAEAGGGAAAGDGADGSGDLAALFAARHGGPSSLWEPSSRGSGARESGREHRPLDGRMARDRRRLLIIDDRVPFPQLGAGYPRAARMLRELHGLGWFVTFYPNYDPVDDWPEIYAAFPREVEFMIGWGRDRLSQFLHERAGYYDAVLVSRPHNMRDYLAARAGTPRPGRLVYDAEAIFATREFLRLEQAGRPVGADERRAILREEIGLTDTADVVTAVNRAEADVFRGAGCGAVAVLGNSVELRPVGTGFAHRRDVLFVGALGEDGSPNADSVAWFVTEIMPALDRRIGSDYRLLVAGRCRAASIQRLAGERVRLLGLVDDLAPLYASARIFVAPTRYAAGLPLKVQEAVGTGLPVVGTELLARQLGWRHGQEMLAASGAEAFAECCAGLYRDPALWYAMRRQGLDRLLADVRANDFVGTLRTVVGSGELSGSKRAGGQRAGNGVPTASAGRASKVGASKVRA